MVFFNTIDSTIYSDIYESLQLIKQGKWEASHHIAQSKEGHKAYDRVHALLHRIEGDEFNARYWYTKLNLSVPKTSFEEETDQLLEELKAYKPKR